MKKVLTYAKGLFNRGIVESGATEGMGVCFAEKEVSVDFGRTIVEKLGVTQIEDIQKVSYGDLQAAAAEAQNEIAEKYKIPVSIGTGYAFEWESYDRHGGVLPERGSGGTGDPQKRRMQGRVVHHLEAVGFGRKLRRSEARL